MGLRSSKVSGSYQRVNRFKVDLFIAQRRHLILERCVIGTIVFPLSLRPGFVIVDYTSTIGGQSTGYINDYVRSGPGIIGGQSIPVFAISRPWCSFQSYIRDRIFRTNRHLAIYDALRQNMNLPGGEIYLRKAPPLIGGNAVLLGVRLDEDIEIDGDVVLFDVTSADHKLKTISARRIYYFRTRFFENRLRLCPRKGIKQISIVPTDEAISERSHAFLHQIIDGFCHLQINGNWLGQSSLLLLSNFREQKMIFLNEQEDNLIINDRTSKIGQVLNGKVLSIYAVDPI